MEQWFAANLGDAMLAGEALEQVRTLFEQSAANGGHSAVLMRHESEGGLHCELKLYFPPELAELAASVGATRCGRPALAGLGVLVGSRERLACLGDAHDS
ncbi:MAG: hypothetical protein H6945_06490 [Zoogloeaceae bacterium]|nr:hypothetical protein [Zoogloeaceae bacterium]